ncbi:MAG: transketolase family protein [Clostridia bacterium]|nr:transketolase family protein [Clostridia bacterium]
MGTAWNAHDANKMSSGKAFGQALAEIAKDDPRIVAVTADLAKSTNTGIFGEQFPDRMFNVGIAEQNLFGVAAGLAKTGLIPFASTFAIFACLRGGEQIRTDCAYQKLPVKVIATHGGLSFGAAGTTHHCIEDFAIMRAIPNMTVCIPGDAYECACIIKQCVNVPGPFYLRVGRGMEPLIHESEEDCKDIDGNPIKIGKAMKLKDGNDVTIMAVGIPTRDALIAAEMLEEQGVSAQVINMHTLKPVDEEAIIEAAVKTRRIVTVEEHNIIGGLGDAVASVLAQSGKKCILSKIGIPDEYGPIGKPEDLYAMYKLSSQGIAETVQEIMGAEIEEEDWSDED